MSPAPCASRPPAEPFAIYEPNEVRAAVGFDDLIEPVARALVDFGHGRGEAPVMVFAPAGRDGDVHVKSAWLPGRAIFTVKVATWFRARATEGAPPGGGFLAAFNAATGELVALLRDEHHLSDVRTAAAGALAARVLARADTTTLGVLGTGVQAYLQTLAAAAVCPVRHVKLWGRCAERTARLASAVRARRPDLVVEAVSSARHVVMGTDLVVTATASAEPLVEAAWLAPGQHLTAVGADDAHKCELEPACLARADRLVVDDRALALAYGDVRRAVAAGAIGAGEIDAELAQVLAGEAPGRRSAEEITVCKLIGLGVEDLAAAEVALERLRTNAAPARRPASVDDLRP